MYQLFALQIFSHLQENILLWRVLRQRRIYTNNTELKKKNISFEHGPTPILYLK